MNRERTTAVTTLRPHVNCSCEIFAKYPHFGRHPRATESEPVRVEEDNHAATVVVLLTALTCDFVGSVMNFDRSPERTWPTQELSRNGFGGLSGMPRRRSSGGGS
jgi:hypothetical protein